MKTILEICQEVADIVGVERPTDLFSPLNYKWFDLMVKELKSLRDYGEWRDTVHNAWFTVRDGKKRYPIDDIAPDFMCLSNCTVFVKDKKERVIAAIIPEQWKRGEYFKIQNGYFMFQNKQPDGTKIMFQYRSTNIAWDFDTFEEKTKLDKNTDVPIFDEYLVKLGVLWRYERYKGVDFNEDYSEYKRELIKRFAMDKVGGK